MRKLLYALALIVPLSGSLSAQSWQQSSVNGHWYMATAPMTWDAAETLAVSVGGHLATIRSQAENSWILSNFYLPGSELWIGFNDATLEGTFEWVSGETPNYTNWHPGEPNNLGGEDYAIFDTTGGTWNDLASVPWPALIELVSADCDGNGLPDVFEIATQPTLDQNGNGILDVCEPGVGYCFGDPGSGIPCPCNNDNDGSVPGSGCDNGVFASGAQLTASGLASVSSDTLVLQTTGLEPNNTGLYFQGNNATNGGNGNWFGDGLRCAGGGVVRIQIRFCDAAGASQTTIPIGAKGGVNVGETKYYQCWYRNQSTPACGLGINEFNLSNGFAVTWLP